MADERAGTQDQLPKVFGRYLLIRRLSQGGMGEIYLAKSGEIQGFEKLVIIKKILPHLAEDRDFIKRFIDEAQIAIKLAHGNIAIVYEVGMVEGEYFLAIEYVEGRDLRRTLSRCHENGQRIPPDLCLYVAREVSNALAYAHRREDEKGRPINLVHCDISPPNVLLSYEGEVKIIDFGIAKSALRISGTNPNVGFGKFGYMAPEQLISGGVIDRRTDTYALGVVLYEMLVGERLFLFPEGTDYREVAAAVTKGEVPFPSERAPHVGRDLDDLVMRALRPDPDDRYQAAEEMRDAIQRLLYAMNPSVSADALGRFLQRIFQAEMVTERRERERVRSTDLSAFKEELEDQRTHTVSFAVAGHETRRGPATTPMRRDPEAEAALLAVADAAPAEVTPISPAAVLTPLTLDAVSRSQRLVRRQPRAGTVAFVAGVAAFAVIGGLLAFLWLRPKPMPVAVPPPQLDAAPAVVAPAPVDAGLAPPVVTQADAAPARPPARHPPPRVAKHPKPPPTKAPPPVVDKPKVSPEKVEAKFRAVRGEYADFKKAYGARLESEWSAVLFLATYGKADKYEKLDGMIDRLRAQMGKVRKGAE
ncbi:MAG: serine/threonine protein kinase [Deltaproteobacteria bacterium]|nr:serine/threonine protein kinase [Deltaproteobacteria bacterium]